MRCNCDGYKLNLPSQHAIENYSAVHGLEYGGQPWAFCPWCGNKLADVPPPGPGVIRITPTEAVRRGLMTEDNYGTQNRNLGS